MIAGVRTCRICGCTDAQACPGGCRWVDVDLCSACRPTLGLVDRMAGDRRDREQAAANARQLLLAAIAAGERADAEGDR